MSQRLSFGSQQPKRSFILAVSLISSCPIYLYFSVSMPLCRLINFPTSNEEWTCFSKIMTWSRGQSCKLNPRFAADPRQRKSFQNKAASVHVRVPSRVWLLVPIHPTNREHHPVTAGVTEQSASIKSSDLTKRENGAVCLGRTFLDLLSGWLDHLSAIRFLLLLHFPP